MNEQLERERAPDDRVGPGAFVVAGPRPVSPRSLGGRNPVLHLVAGREHERLLLGDADRDQGRLAGAHIDASSNRFLVGGRLVRVPALDGERAGARSCNRDPEPPLDTSVRLGVAEAGLDAPAEGDLARNPLDAPDQLANRRESRAGDGHDIDDADRAARREPEWRASPTPTPLQRRLSRGSYRQ